MSSGAAEVIDYTTTRFEEVLATVDAVIDLIGNVHDDTGVAVAARCCGRAASSSTARPAAGRRCTTTPTTAGVRATGYRVAAGRLDARDHLAPARARATCKVYVDQVFDLADAADAHRALERGHTRGKIVLRVTDALERPARARSRLRSESPTRNFLRPTIAKPCFS